jgi:hypothetical protein
LSHKKIKVNVWEIKPLVAISSRKARRDRGGTTLRVVDTPPLCAGGCGFAPLAGYALRAVVNLREVMNLALHTIRAKPVSAQRSVGASGERSAAVPTARKRRVPDVGLDVHSSQ